MSNKQPLPMYSVGPVYVSTIVLLTALRIGLSGLEKLPVIRFNFLKIPLIAIGIV